MGERGARHIGVDQRGDEAGAREAQPGRQIFRPVGHEQADDVALAEALRARPAGIAIGASVPRAIGKGLALAEQRDAIAILGRQFISEIAIGAGRVLADRRGAGERPPEAAQISEFAFDPVEQ